MILEASLPLMYLKDYKYINSLNINTDYIITNQCYNNKDTRNIR